MFFTHNDMIVYIGYPKQCTKNLLELIKGFNKFAWYNNNIKYQL